MTDTSQHAKQEIAAAFLRLGLTSFGGPIAHLGYFREELVQRRRWVNDEAYGEILALSQFLPGPASSQTAFLLGWQRGGFTGAVIATLAFTLPSAVMMIALATLIGTAPSQIDIIGGLISGLKITAVAVVAHAVLGMTRSLAPKGARAGIAIAAVLLLLLQPSGIFTQITAILAGAVIGYALRIAPPTDRTAVAPLRSMSRLAGAITVTAFFALLILLPIGAGTGPLAQIADIFYRAGALVFGGGHVVLPLLQSGTSGLVSDSSFIAGYAVAQAMPGPLFTFAGWLGQIAGGLPAAIIALIAIFLPGFLLVAGVLPFWAALSRQKSVYHAIAGANAAVVGILAHALYDPVFTSGIRSIADFALAVFLFVMLTLWKKPAWQAVILGALGGIAIGVWG